MAPRSRPLGAAIPAELRAMIAHHDQLQGTLRGHVDALLDVAANGHDLAAKRTALQHFLTHELIPYTLAEEGSTYVAGASVAALTPLVDGLLLEHRALVELAAEIADGDTGLATVCAAYAFLALFEVHVDKENDLLLPALIGSGADPTQLLNTMRRALAARRKEVSEEMESQGTGVGAPDTGGIAAHQDELVVDTRVETSSSCANLATTAVDSLSAGGSFVLVADHDPRGIDYMLRAERPGATSWEVLEDGPERWQVRIARTAAVA